MRTRGKSWGGILRMLAVVSVALSGCGGSAGGGSSTRTVQLDVAATGHPVSWTGNVGQVTGDDVEVSGTTPASQLITVQVHDFCAPPAGCSKLPILASVGTTVTTSLIVCLTNLNNGKQ